MESYHLGKRQVSHHKRNVVLLAFGVPMIIAGALFAKSFFNANTVISPPPPAVVTNVTSNEGPTKQFDEGVFTISLPTDWVYTGRQTEIAPYAPYTWHNTKANPGVEQLAVYVDTIPTNLGVNRVLPVQGEGDRTIPTTVSDTCADFTGNKVPGSATTPAKWDGINFLCDLANYERDVVGTSSADGVNTVKVTGSTGSHQIFFTYTDNGATPNFTIFEDAVSSFRLK